MLDGREVILGMIGCALFLFILAAISKGCELNMTRECYEKTKDIRCWNLK